MAKRYSYDDVSRITGEDIENLQNEEHPGESLDEDMEGSGIDEPNLDKAEWDVKIEEEDSDDPHWEGIDLEDLTSVDREVYLTLSSLRRNIHEALTNAGGGWDSLMGELDQFKAQLENPQDNPSRLHFYAMINNKLAGLSLELQMAKRKRPVT